MRVSRDFLEGEAGPIELASSAAAAPRAVAVIAHPHPLFGGTMENKVVTTIARAFVEAGAAVFRFNFRGVGASAGQHDQGRGETRDMLRVIAHAQALHPGLPLWLAGFSFGGAVALAASAQVSAAEMVLVAPAFKRLADWPADTGADPPAGKVPESAFIIHGETDETVPLRDSLDWARTREIPVLVVPGADHFFHQKLHLIRRLVRRAITD